MTYDSVILSDSPVLYYKMDETSGTVLTDSGSAADNLTLGASTSFSQGALYVGGQSLKGIAGQWVGSNATASPSSIIGPPITVETWIDYPGTSGNPYIFNYGNGGTRGYSIVIGGTTLNSNGTRLVAVNWGWNWKAASTTLSPGIHHVVAVSASAGNWTFYVDGTSIGSVSNSGSINALTSDAMNVCYPNTGVCITRQAATAVYASALSAARVSAHYAAGTAVGGPGFKLAEPLRRQALIRAAHY